MPDDLDTWRRRGVQLAQLVEDWQRVAAFCGPDSDGPCLRRCAAEVEAILHNDYDPLPFDDDDRG